MAVAAGARILDTDLIIAVNPPLAMLRQAVAQNFPTSGTYAALTFDTEDFDSHNGHSTVTNTSRYTAVVAGVYELSGGCSFTTGGAASARTCRWLKNGAVVNGSASGFPVPATNVASTWAARTILVTLAVGDFVELQAVQSSGGALTTHVGNPEFMPTMVVRWVSN